MISSDRLRETLLYLDAQFSSTMSGSADPIIPTIYCKIATMEVCGWIEQAIDEIILSCANPVSRQQIKSAINERLKKTYGMNYANNIRPLLLLVGGAKNLDSIECLMEESGKLSILEAHLTHLHTARNPAAHTHLSAPNGYDAPSMILTRLNAIEPIIKDIGDLLT